MKSRQLQKCTPCIYDQTIFEPAKSGIGDLRVIRGCGC
jgi:hypothetical protein